MSARPDAAHARAAFERRAWDDAFRRFVVVDGTAPLGVEDLQRMAVAAGLSGRDEDAEAAWERAYQTHIDADAPAAAARCAFWLGMDLVNRSEVARGGGWLARARRVLHGATDCAEHGYLLLPDALRAMESGDAATAQPAFREAAAIGERFDDADLVALAHLGVGQCLIRLGRGHEGLALLDEVMLAVESGEVSPIPSGVIYCAVIAVCNQILDLRRAQEWTSALSDWCAAQPDLVPFRGQCLVHRSQILQVHGAWQDAMTEAQNACDRLAAAPSQPAAGGAFYQVAELHRLRGELTQAEQAYLRASTWGHSTQPGLALLWVAQGRTAAAAAALRRALDETDDPIARARLLAADAESALAAGDVERARAACDELRAIAEELAVPLLQALSADTEGAVLLAAGRAADALPPLRSAAAAWRQIEAPYEAARTRTLIGRACRELGDADSAQLELDGARQVFAELGAALDLARLDRRTSPPSPPGGLTGREVQVLRLVAAGRSNRAIATELVISEHTVARHLQNIFVKLDVDSRTAAAAFAFAHDLV